MDKMLLATGHNRQITVMPIIFKSTGSPNCLIFIKIQANTESVAIKDR